MQISGNTFGIKYLVRDEMEQGLYTREPIRIQNGIPVFVDGGEYAENYEKISSDHINAIDGGMENPFIDSMVWKEIENNAINALIENVKDGEKVLDIGVGTGRLLRGVPRAKRYGIDVSLNYLERLSDSGIELCMGSVECLPYPDGFFDVVACTDVLEHVFDLNAAISEIVRVLKPHGIFILRVPYKEDLSQYLSKDLPYKYVHVRNFDEYALEILFCRVFDFSLEAKLLDYAMHPDALKAKKFFRGRGVLVKLLRSLVLRAPALKRNVMGLFHPIEITMVFRSHVSAK